MSQTSFCAAAALVKEQKILRGYPLSIPSARRTVESNLKHSFDLQRQLWIGKPVLMSPRAIHRDPNIWKDPDTFDPARYLNHTLPAADYINVSDPYERDHFTYGAGRRVCPGVHVAERSLYINISRVLWGFNITKKVGPDGNLIEPTQTMVRGFMSVPELFECDITPRSEGHARIMREEFARAEKEGI
jgi:cytochrome P450